MLPGTRAIVRLAALLAAGPLLLSAPWAGGAQPAAASNASFIRWHTDTGRLDADIPSQPLLPMLSRMASATGWQIFVEPDLDFRPSATFKNRTAQDGLRLLLGNLNFALLPGANGGTRLYVFNTTMERATQAVNAATRTGSVANELIVRLKPGAGMDDLARALGATVAGQIEGINAYRLRFDGEDATAAARQRLTKEAGVLAVDANYEVPRPDTPMPLQGNAPAPLTVRAKPVSEGGPIVVGLVDTPIQSLGADLDAFVLPGISIAGPAAPDPSSPTHATSMAETLLRSVQNFGHGRSSVRILPVDVYGKDATTTTFDVALGVARAVNAGANLVNLSLGSDVDSAVLHEVVKQARAQGVAIFAAAGNEPTTQPFYPAAYHEVTAVTATQGRGQLAAYASRGSFVDIAAPGSSVVYYNGQPFYVTGTSAASAFASGLAAALAETQKQTPAQAEAALRARLATGTGPSGGPP